ncbi:MAG: hypothetical protein IPO92_12875 [Saprospiraceae bacterium]|nr:hypothetical protein [Saprospiraceae bacterium]
MLTTVPTVKTGSSRDGVQGFQGYIKPLTAPTPNLSCRCINDYGFTKLSICICGRIIEADTWVCHGTWLIKYGNDDIATVIGVEHPVATVVAITV